MCVCTYSPNIINIFFVECANNLQGQKRPERKQDDFYFYMGIRQQPSRPEETREDKGRFHLFMSVHVCGHEGREAESLRGRRQPTINKRSLSWRFSVGSPHSMQTYKTQRCKDNTGQEVFASVATETVTPT